MKPRPIHIICAILAALLTVAVIGDVIGYRFVHKAFDNYNDSRLDPLGELGWRLDSIATGHHALVILGDSHARNWEKTRPEALNLGIPSQTSVQVRLRADRYREHLSGQCLVVIAGGNDLKSITTNLSRTDEIVDNCVGSIAAIVADYEDAFDQIVVVTVPPVFRLPFTYRVLHRPELNQAHLDMNQGIRRVARSSGVVLLDAYEVLSHAGDLQALSDDGVHMNEAGYALLDGTLRELLSRAPVRE